MKNLKKRESISFWIGKMHGKLTFVIKISQKETPGKKGTDGIYLDFSPFDSLIIKVPELR